MKILRAILNAILDVIDTTMRVAMRFWGLAKFIVWEIGQFLLGALRLLGKSILIILWIVTLTVNILGVFDLAVSNYVITTTEYKGLLHEAGQFSPLLFVASVSATIILFVQKFDDVANFLNLSVARFQKQLERTKIEIVGEFIAQAKIGARLVDVGTEHQVESLYRDAAYICGYYPVHTVLQYNRRLRHVLAESMRHKSFRTYDMIVGRQGKQRLIEMFDTWCDQIDDAKRAHDLGACNREERDLITFLRNIRVRFNQNIDEKDEVRITFFYVLLPDGVRRRGVIYIWTNPFGFNFDQVNGALILEGDSGYLSGLYGIFAAAWSENEESEAAVMKEIRNRIVRRMGWPTVPNIPKDDVDAEIRLAENLPGVV